MSNTSILSIVAGVVMALAVPLAHSADTSSASGSTSGGQPPQGGPGGGGRPPGPPPEAIAACTGKTVGTQVSFKIRSGETVTGVCQLDNGVLAARPAGGPPPGGQGGQGGQPPQRGSTNGSSSN
jgi:hypothetical protein